MKSTFLLAFSLFFSTLHAQYYYTDVIGTQETNRQMKTYLAEKVRTVAATGYDKQGAKTNEFSELQEIKDKGATLRISTFSGTTKTVLLNRFDALGRVIVTIDSSASVISSIKYDYDNAGRIIQIQNIVTDPASDFNQTETHQWFYSISGKPDRMYRIINTGSAIPDSLEIRFLLDENGNLGEERTYRRGLETGYLYYYYDEKNRLTDIVRYNTKLKKLLPDVMFEYNDNDYVIQKLTPTSNSNLGYLIWRYVFDAKGLKTKEALFNDDKQMTGKIEYNYTFNSSN